uniref:Ycf36 n=1 Tax=Characiopsis acuta TaxID=2040456 RepID=A0A3R5U8V0_9STRA|nr:hypothetical protein Ycf36 [Characiopsis acuta]QAA11358.1 hypothetical protein Ycf36 [Characiopsis acuta]
MNKFNKSRVCPVPRQQRPFFEYLKSRNSNFLNWVSLNEFTYTKKFFVVLFFNTFLSFSLTNYFISFLDYPIRLLIISFFVSLILQTLLYCYFFTNWEYIGYRLVERKVFYEESGWYNQKVWIKPQSILKQELVLYNYQLIPLITRIKKTLSLILTVFFLLIGLILISLY